MTGIRAEGLERRRKGEKAGRDESGRSIREELRKQIRELRQELAHVGNYRCCDSGMKR